MTTSSEPDTVWRITIPNKDLIFPLGSMGPIFANGVGYTEEATIANTARNRGYEVTEMTGAQILRERRAELAAAWEALTKRIEAEKLGFSDLSLEELYLVQKFHPDPYTRHRADATRFGRTYAKTARSLAILDPIDDPDSEEAQTDYYFS